MSITPQERFIRSQIIVWFEGRQSSDELRNTLAAKARLSPEEIEVRMAQWVETTSRIDAELGELET